MNDRIDRLHPENITPPGRPLTPDLPFGREQSGDTADRPDTREPVFVRTGARAGSLAARAGIDPQNLADNAHPDGPGRDNHEGDTSDNSSPRADQSGNTPPPIDPPVDGASGGFADDDPFGEFSWGQPEASGGSEAADPVTADGPEVARARERIGAAQNVLDAGFTPDPVELARGASGVKPEDAARFNAILDFADKFGMTIADIRELLSAGENVLGGEAAVDPASQLDSAEALRQLANELGVTLEEMRAMVNSDELTKPPEPTEPVDTAADSLPKPEEADAPTAEESELPVTKDNVMTMIRRLYRNQTLQK
jgi:hypothetical protein